VAVRTTETKPRVAITDLTETAGTTIMAAMAGAGSTVEAMVAAVEEETAEEVEGATDHAPPLSHLLVLHVDQR
jgi:hypothetical protein